jgi:hypothetical protein
MVVFRRVDSPIRVHAVQTVQNFMLH